MSVTDSVMSRLRKALPMPLRKAYWDVRAGLLSIGLPRGLTAVQPEREDAASQGISIIVAVKDAPIFLQRCLGSLEQYARRAEIIVVDDGSELKETLTLLDEYCTRNLWTLIRHDRSKGHSKACGAGAQVATRQYLCFLNSDTIVTPWSWWAAKDAFEADPRMAVTGPSTSWSATSQTIRRAAHCRHHWNDSQICAFAKTYVEGRPPRSWVDLPEAGGFAFFVRHNVWTQLGGMDPNLPDYGNESEFCKRVLRQGMRVVWTQNSYIHHFGEQSYGQLGEGFARERSRIAREYINRKQAGALHE